jgi:hypothetical protein
MRGQDEQEITRRSVRLDEEHRVVAQASASGAERVCWMFTFAAAAYNLLRIRNLIRSAPQPQWA